MQTARVLAVAVLLAVAACGGDDATDPQTAGDAGGSGDARNADVVKPQPPGQARAAVDGREFTLTEPGALACTVGDESVTFSFRIGDNEITLGGGANRTDDEWFGGIDFVVANPDGEAGPIAYFPELPANSAGMAVDGDSFSYSGPMLKRLPNDGTNPPPVAVGDGIITLTCP